MYALVLPVNEEDVLSLHVLDVDGLVAELREGVGEAVRAGMIVEGL